MRKLFTSESVTEGHPDKVCDRISDAVLDAVLAKDSEGRVACETCCTTDTVFIAGEITSKVDVDIEGIARRVLRDIGYTGGASGFDADTCKVMVSVHKQSPDIAMGRFYKQLGYDLDEKIAEGVKILVGLYGRSEAHDLHQPVQ